ncbi:hypothetical protein BSL78_16108 [Apostichopus japonicus]|uniref:NLR family CARD domain-containing protein 4 n=1 Tax=Stichopus japonicus TaxID=307972 RepID=A0A2G8KGA0_STIJA|nr:hypothetical protein BSL78_16108 [Apostichopus japonicus]
MCATLQYLELFQSGTVQCAFEEGYLGIQWYDSTTIGTPPIITFVKSVKGGSGYLSREYDVYPNGSLIINNVTLHHERIFSVSVAASEDEPIKDWYIQVKSKVTPVLSFPVIERCEDQPDVCLFVNNQLSSINCFVENVRPTVSLAWYQRISNHDQLLTAWSNVTASQGNTFTSLASLQLARELPLLSVFVCKVEDNKWLFNEDEAVAILEGQDVDPKDNPVKQYFEVNSEMTLSCNEGNVVIWKRSLDVDGQTEVILISINNWKNSVNQTYNQDYRLGSNGSLILHRPKWHHAGLYICLSSDSNAEHIRIYNVLIFKSPNPPHIIIEGCTPPQSCVLEVKQEGNITCSVLGIRPEVELMWKSQYDTNDFSLSGQEVKSNEREGSFDVFLSGNFKFEATFADEITLECLVVGSNADLFHMSTKVKLIPKFEETSDSKRKLPIAVLILTVLALVIIITMAVLLVLFKVLRRKPRKQDGHNAEETAPMINFQNEDTGRFIKEIKTSYEVLYDAVQPIPYIKDRLFCVNRIYVEGGMDMKTLNLNWKPVESHDEILKEVKKSSMYIIEGEPGYGKSTFALQLVYDWCNTRSTSALTKTDILIFLRLRQLKGVPSVYEAIKRFILPKDSKFNVDDIESIISRCSSLFVLLDGYDEYPDQESVDTDIAQILGKNMFQDAVVFLTTRSFCLPKNIAPQAHRLRLTGFNDSARDQYIYKAVAGNDRESAEVIKRKLQQNPVLGDLCQVPLFFVMFAHMTHESEELQTFKSVTSFFRYMISCFHSHSRNKIKDVNIQRKNEELEKRHSELNKVAFEALSGGKQDIQWGSEILQKRLGEDFYDLYNHIGILVEEEVLENVFQSVVHMQYTKKVRFYHKLFCEWYAAHYIATVLSDTNNISNSDKEYEDMNKLLSNMDPFDLQYVYRFACGLNKSASDKIIRYLQKQVKDQRFAALCFLEQVEQTDGIADVIKQMVSKPVKISADDSNLLQRSTLQILEFATKIQVPISCVHLHKSCDQFDKASFVLKSGLMLPKLLTVEKILIEIAQNGREPRTLGKDELRQIFNIGMDSQQLKELSFDGCLLPIPFPVDTIPAHMKSKEVKVTWRRYGYRLNLRSGDWKVDDPSTVSRLCSEMIEIRNEHSYLLQKCTIELLLNASKCNISISDLWLINSFRTTDGVYIILRSKLRLACPSSVEKLWIQEDKNEITETSCLEIMKFVQQSKQIKELVFYKCLVPRSISPESIPTTMTSGNKKVSWNPKQQYYNLNVNSGRWFNQRSEKEMTDEEYADITSR